MKTFRFQGYSDDTFGEYEQTNDDYDNCASGEPIQYALATPDGAGVIITGCYCAEINKGQGWMIGVETENSQADLSSWQFTMHPGHEGYRNSLTVVAPDDAALVCLNREEDE